MKLRMHRVRTIDLDHDQMLIIDDGREGRVRVLYGATWLTPEVDAIGRAGAQSSLCRGRTPIEASGPARLPLAEVAAHWSEGWRRAWQRLQPRTAAAEGCG